MWTNEHLMNIAEQLLVTSDILAHPVWNLRCQTPCSKSATVPCHQIAKTDEIAIYIPTAVWICPSLIFTGMLAIIDNVEGLALSQTSI